LLSRTKLGLILWRTHKDASRALSELSRAVADAEQLVREDPGSVDARSNLAWCLHDQGSVLIETGRTQDALAAHRRAIEINRVLCNERAGDLPRRAALAENLNNLGLSTDVSDPGLAEKSYSEAASILEDIVRQSTNLRWVASLGSVLNNQGNLAQSVGQTDRASQCFQRGLALLDEALEREPGETILRYTALNLHGSRANLLTSLGRHAEAVSDWDKVIELNDEPADRITYRLMRILELLRTKDYRRGISEALAVSTQQSDSGKLAGPDLYNYACIFGLASVAAQADDRLDASERRRRARAYADTSLKWLERAVGAGFFDDPKNRDHAARDSDLAPLRDRPEFRKLLRAGSP
jgi:tetratricopeptide (TPR) repeat protein